MFKENFWRKLLVFVMSTILVMSLFGCSSEEKEKVAENNEENISSEEDGVFPFELVTKDDQVVTFTHVPERVLSVNVNTGEQLMALGLGDKIIGTAYNNDTIDPQYEKEYNSKPVIAEKSPSLEVVLDLEPDFIYGRSSAFSEKDTTIATHDKLSEYGIMSLSSYESYKLGADVEDVYQDFYNLGKIFAVEDRAEAIVDRMKANIAKVEEKIQNVKPVRVFNFDMVTEDGAYTPGNNFTSKLIRRAGGINVFEDLEKTWNTVSWEAVIEHNPQVIIVNDYGNTPLEEKLAYLQETQALKDIDAIKNGRIFAVSLPEVFANARIDKTIEKFAKQFHPEAFE